MRSDLDVVTYDGLPVSAGGAHSLRAKNPRTAYASLRAFVDAAAIPLDAPALSFQMWNGGPADVSDKLKAFAAAQFGGPQRRQSTHTEWRVRPDTIEAALTALSDAGPRAVTPHGSPLAALVWSAEVALLDPALHSRYPGIDADAFGRFPVDGYGHLLGASGIRATLGTTASSLSLRLAFPGDERLPGAAAHVQDHLPFRLSTKHWRRWRATKNGQSYRATKIASPLAA